jgi:hypothetical protein
MYGFAVFLADNVGGASAIGIKKVTALEVAAT